MQYSNFFGVALKGNTIVKVKRGKLDFDEQVSAKDNDIKIHDWRPVSFIEDDTDIIIVEDLKRVSSMMEERGVSGLNLAGCIVECKVRPFLHLTKRDSYSFEGQKLLKELDKERFVVED